MATVSPSHSLDIPQRKSYDKAPVGNTFLYTTGPSDDNGYFESHQSSDHQLINTPKNGSAPPLNGTRSSISTYHRDRRFSKSDSTHSLGGGSGWDHREPGRSSAVLLDESVMDRTRDASIDSGSVISASAPPPTNGNLTQPRSPNPKPVINGDSRPSADGYAFRDVNYSAAGVPLSTSAPENVINLPQESHRLAVPAQRPMHRHSSPPPPSTGDSSYQSLSSPSLKIHRHTLQVPRAVTSRKNSRDLSDDSVGVSSGLLSPTGGALRRASVSLVHRATRSGQSEPYSDEAPPDEDAARWAEAIKQKRARKKRREEDDDDRVIVGTKVDQNHVNWVTAYNMLTGIRFVVSRVNAKMGRELTPADFESKHKFSFDM
jgi:1-phosphatidylinositol-4-phosphate 5-kinase